MPVRRGPAGSDRHGPVCAVAVWVHQRHRLLPVGLGSVGFALTWAGCTSTRSSRWCWRASDRATGYLPLWVTAGLTQVELAEQLMPSLRLDGYFILTDLIGVPDLFQRIGPVLRSLVPGQPADPRVGALKRAARIALTAWVLAMVPLLGGELVLIVVGIPKLATGFARSLAANADAVTAHFGRGEVAAGLVSVISVVLLIFPMAGIAYLLVLTGRAAVRLAAAATRKHRMLGLPVAAAAALAVGALAYTWGLLPLPGQPAAPVPHLASPPPPPCGPPWPRPA